MGNTGNLSVKVTECNFHGGIIASLDVAVSESIKGEESMINKTQMYIQNLDLIFNS